MGSSRGKQQWGPFEACRSMICRAAELPAADAAAAVMNKGRLGEVLG